MQYRDSIKERKKKMHEYRVASTAAADDKLV